MQNIQHRNHHFLRRLIFGCNCRESKAEQQRETQCRKHAQDGAQQVVRQIDRIKGNGRGFANDKRPTHLHGAERKCDQYAEHQRQQYPIPAIGCGTEQRALCSARIKQLKHACFLYHPMFANHPVRCSFPIRTVVTEYRKSALCE